MMYAPHILKKILPVFSTLALLGVPLTHADAHHRGGFGRSFGRGMGMGLGTGIGYGVAQYGMHRVFGGYHHHYFGGYRHHYYGNPYYRTPYYGNPYDNGYSYPNDSDYMPQQQTNITIIQQTPPAPPSDVPVYPYPVPGYTHYQPGSGYTTEPQITYVPGYGNVPVSSPITP